MDPSQHKNVSRVVLDLGDGRMAAPGAIVTVDPERVADHIAGGRLKAVSVPPSKPPRARGGNASDEEPS